MRNDTEPGWADLQAVRQRLGNPSERALHYKRKTDPTFPTARLICGRPRWSLAEIDSWAASQPTVKPQPEPPQLARSTKRSQFTPKPEAWPPPPGAAERMVRPQHNQHVTVADDASRSAETRSGAE